MSIIDTFNITIIGAGVVGLAMAEELSDRYKRVLLVEKNTGFGQETSSRNSEVIHAGIYYPHGFLKAALCTEGNHLLYELCRERNIPHKRLGKLIVATNNAECERLESIKKHAEGNGVADLTLLGKKQIMTLEPEICAKAAIFSPSTGIIDSHNLMRSFCVHAEANGTIIAFRSVVTAIQNENGAYELETNGGEYRFRTKVLINSAGLYSDRIAAVAGIDIDRMGYRLKYCKGNYFAASPAPKLYHLVYPVPPENTVSLGIHATRDLGNRIKFGPDSQYIDEIEYSVDEGRRTSFYLSIKKYLPGISEEMLHPDMCGIRPKLQGPGEPPSDFVIKDEKDIGYPGLINLIGIESPGLTSCITIARHVQSLVTLYI
ncbi:MAG TPA: NAD(P)/FAD-dependent oxidoreductase [Syntrophales bacterium]|nr:NAD(P)/FAD-dependent oxidoreductase [Syntrophales bacterium]